MFSCPFLMCFSICCGLVTYTDAFVLIDVICCFVTSDPMQIYQQDLSVIYFCVEGAFNFPGRIVA